MAQRRKSLIVSMFDAHQKNKRAKQREQEKADREYRAQQARMQRELAKQVEQQQREQERQWAASQQAAKRAEEARKREDAARAREAEKAAAARVKRDREALAEARLAEADQETLLLDQRREGLESLLADRMRNAGGRVEEATRAFNVHGPVGFAAHVEQLLAASVYPDGTSGAAAVGCRPESRELLIEMELPGEAVIPAVVGYQYIKSKDEIRAVAVKDADRKRAYSRLLARLVLRTLAEAFDATPPTLIQEIVINAFVSSADRATGKPIRPCLISVSASREKFEELVLDQPALDPELCLRGFLNAIVSPHPHDLEAVRPVLDFDLSHYKLAEEVVVASGLDSRTDLLTLRPVEFEHLIRELFEAIGLKSWVTQASRDDGVDGVAINPDPIVGGLCIIQAKRYSHIVGLEAVNALAGVMNDKAAAKGVLVTTSWVGKASREFATRNGRIEIIEGRHLKSLLREHLGLDVLIGLPKLPPGWKRSELT